MNTLRQRRRSGRDLTAVFVVVLLGMAGLPRHGLLVPPSGVRCRRPSTQPRSRRPGPPGQSGRRNSPQTDFAGKNGGVAGLN